ncbi:EamA family transporter [Flavobacterium sp. Sd200]|uniref:DMT family transporter n=1 Tax=Flavobacterium sp. Sd200 TaxID=2692211 RepID=UPI0013681D98|nr:DMT family transporter [Flavobacterium sp. Sd200]MXN89674.1 EamA family transporter [Flavobacterium sp. Sd200]
MQGDSFKNNLHLHLIVFVWGFTAVLGKLITLSAFPLVWFRMCVGISIIFVYGLIVKAPFKISAKTLVRFALAGLVIALHWFTFFQAIKVSNISVTLACLSTGAFFASLFETVFYGKKIVWYELLLSLLVILALCIIIYGDFFVALFSKIAQGPFSFSVLSQAIESTPTGNGHLLLGIVIALFSASLSALFAIINGKFAKEYNSVTISFYELLGGIFFFSLYLLFKGEFTVGFFTLSSSDWLWLFILGSVCTGYAQIAAVKVMKTITPYTMMLTINLEPVYGIILALLVFRGEEQMGYTFYIGAAIILITVIINGVLKNKAETAK